MSIVLGTQERIVTFRVFLTISMAIISSLVTYIVRNYNVNDSKLFVKISFIGTITTVIILLFLLKMLFFYIGKLEKLKKETK